MRVLRVWLVFFLIMVGIPTATLAQSGDAEDCPTLVDLALATTDEVCALTGRNEACYGHVWIDAEPAETTGDIQFEQAGDIIDVAALQQLRLSTMDTADDTWGIALMRIQANLPDALPGQNVTLVLFGDVTIDNAGEESPWLEVTATANSNVRAQPSTGSRIVDRLSESDTARADGRLSDSSWLRIRLAEGGWGWVSADLLSSTGDSATLPVVDPAADTPSYGPMQAFYLQTGLGDAPCAPAPPSGLLLQTPTNEEPIELLVNDVSIRLSSTAFLQAVADDLLYVYLLEGRATVEAFGQERTLIPGSRVTVPIDADLHASGPPNPPEPYAETVVQALPTSLLQRAFIMVEPPAAEVIEAQQVGCTLTAPGTINVRSGPGTSYPQVYQLRGGESMAVYQQVVGVQGLTWWLMEDGYWVRSDLVTTEGPCDLMPVVQQTPTIPTPVPYDESLNINVCYWSNGGVWSEPVSPNVIIGASPGTVRVESAEIIRDGGMAPTLRIDGADRGAPFFTEYKSEGAGRASVAWYWRGGSMSPGTHQIEYTVVVRQTIPYYGENDAYTLSPGWTNVWTCTITVP